MEKIRKRMVFQGRVQGVGFRWHARHAALALGLTGWVRNEYDGSVTMEIQGSEAGIDRLIQELQAGRYIDIQDIRMSKIPTDPEERDFRVRVY
ncbi:MAG: acylphosphatase [Eubacterium sp.]|nr:acylphosphatase [Eubacterium sp.]